MSDTCRYMLIIIQSCYILLLVSQTIFGKNFSQINQINQSKALEDPDIEYFNQTILDYDFFSFDVIDHRTLLVKFDLSENRVFKQTNLAYYGRLYVSKIPAVHYRINIGLFLGYYEKEIDATIADHLTFCLDLKSRAKEKQINQTKTIFHRYLKSSSAHREYRLHYCAKIGPEEERHRHPKKQANQGDHVLLLLQVMMIGIFLVIIQFAHMIRSRKHNRWRHRLRLALRFHREHPSLSHDGLALLQFIKIHDQEPQDDEQKQEETEQEEGGEEDSLTSSNRGFPSVVVPRIRYRPASPTFEGIPSIPNDSSIEHILESKPWLQIPK